MDWKIKKERAGKSKCVRESVEREGRRSEGTANRKKVITNEGGGEWKGGGDGDEGMNEDE